jgi:hypothetical protein
VDVAPSITSKKIKVKTVSAMNPDISEYLPGEYSPNPFCPNPFTESSYPTFPDAVAYKIPILCIAVIADACYYNV